MIVSQPQCAVAVYDFNGQFFQGNRAFDFTCCDIEPAILGTSSIDPLHGNSWEHRPFIARNVLLLTMIADSRPSVDTADKMWNIFFHFFLDEESTAFLGAQCQKLLRGSTSLDVWNKSEYSSFLHFCNDHTRLELRRHWQLYVDAGRSPSKEKLGIKKIVLSGMEKARAKHKVRSCDTSCRSAGPYVSGAMTAAPKVFSHFWTTGTTFVDEEVRSSAINVNPTFVYSLVGTDFSVHYGASPIAPFHLAPAFLGSKPDSEVTASDLVDCAKSQFRDWITCFRTFLGRQAGRIVIRLFCGDALCFCQALAEYRVTGSVSGDQTVAQWDTTPLVFDGPDYTPGNTSAPLTFNVVETSNLADHVGLLNVLIATAPLLSETHSATLFTETLLYVGNDPTKSFNQKLCVDLPTIGILLNLLPTSYPSNFSSRSNVTEIILHKCLATQVSQYYERLAWRRPTTSDALASMPGAPTIRQVAFEPPSLAKILLRIYFRMFSSDDAMSGLVASKSMAELSIVHYIRETFVALVATIKGIVVVDWETTLGMFFDLLENTKSSFMLMASHYHQELCAQFYLAGIYTVGSMTVDVTKQGRFRGWRQVPPTVSVTFVVPRKSIQVLLDVDQTKLSTPIMQAAVKNGSAHSSFSSIKVGFGKVRNSGTGSDPRIIFDADPAGWAGSSPLVVSFSLPSWMLHLGDPERVIIALSLRVSPQTVHLVPKLGMDLRVFTTRLMDTSVVFVAPEEPHGVSHRLCNMPTPARDSDDRISAVIGAEGDRVSMLTARAEILDGPTRTILSSGAPVTSRQVSPCIIEISIGPKKRQLIYPSPVIGNSSKLSIARKSCYVEVSDDSPFPLNWMSHVHHNRSLLLLLRNMALAATHFPSRSQKRSKRLGIFIASIWMSSPPWTFLNRNHCVISPCT